LDIQQKSGGGKEDIRITFDPYGENLVKATLPGASWTYHLDEENQLIHMMVRHSGMVS
jgi:hypothetical protein